MNSGLEQVKAAIILALEKSGTVAVPALAPGQAKSYDTPVVAVGFRMGESRSIAMNNYLGQQIDPDSQTVREVYGMQLELLLSMDIFSPVELGAQGCEDTLTALHRVMMEGLPAGIKPTELKWEETSWDADTGMFLRRGSLSCGAYFLAMANEEGAMLTDFILKGVLTK